MQIVIDERRDGYIKIRQTDLKSQKIIRQRGHYIFLSFDTARRYKNYNHLCN